MPKIFLNVVSLTGLQLMRNSFHDTYARCLFQQCWRPYGASQKNGNTPNTLSL